ncbi:MAG: YebC/PmpR family DNA-binding transcriptional regulator [bacterium]|nr:YebC/PmpR family DNA-binding transcriptional regulator [bacterium]
MSGHSKWAQIKHKKAASDAKKGTLFSKMVRLIMVAAKDKGGGPTMNPKLRMAIEKARSIGMPKDNIERAIVRGSIAMEAGSLEEVFYEAYGPGGAALLIHGITDSSNRTTNEIKHALSEHGGKLAGKGSVEWLFEKLGAVDIPQNKNTIPRDDLMLILIDAGAKDVKDYEGGVTAYIAPQSAESYKETLDKKNIISENARIDYLPKTPLILNEKDEALLEKLITALNEDEDIQEIYTNAEN